MPVRRRGENRNKERRPHGPADPGQPTEGHRHNEQHRETRERRDADQEPPTVHVPEIQLFTVLSIPRCRPQSPAVILSPFDLRAMKQAVNWAMQPFTNSEPHTHWRPHHELFKLRSVLLVESAFRRSGEAAPNQRVQITLLVLSRDASLYC